jgi:hypothetical protein
MDRAADKELLAQRKPTFRKQSNVWELWFQKGDPVYVKDARGMAYIHLLLQHPLQEYSAAELRAAVMGLPGASSADLGPLLDARAVTAYKRRVDHLREELREARAENDLARVDRYQRELHLLEAELRRALGMGGRHRHATDTERARKAVTNAVRRALAELQRAHAALAGHLSAALSLGTRLSYAPEVEVTWLL